MAARPRSLAACVALSLLVSSSAAAYCRTHTADPVGSGCPEVCSQAGQALYWAYSNPTYAFNEHGFPELSIGQLRGIFEASFRTWQSVSCNQQPIGLEIRAKSSVTGLEVGPEADEPNENVIVHFSAAEWAARDLPARAFAITAVWFTASEGEILGADMMFNGRMDAFGECSPDGCAEDEPDTDLGNVATHEIGHFLGLSHSDVPDSTMWCDAQAHETTKRTLSPDDVAGICAIYPPGQAFLHPASDRASHACGLVRAPTASSRGGPAGSLVLLASLWWRRRRRP